MAPHAMTARMAVLYASLVAAFAQAKVALKNAFASAALTRDRRMVAHQLVKDTAGNINMGAALTIAGLIVTAVVALNVLAALSPLWFSSTGSLAENFSTADVGDDTANSIANGVFPLIIALLGVFAIAGLAFLTFKLRKG